MRAVVKKWGNSASFVFPDRSCKLPASGWMKLWTSAKSPSGLSLSRSSARNTELAELVKGITRKNLHAEIDFSKPVGNEVW